MKEKKLDHLDENGNLLGEIDRKTAHRVGAWHKSVHIYLVNAKGQLLLQLRSKNKDIAPNVWDISVGGHVDAGERTTFTAKRELFEELGIAADEGEFELLFTIKEVLQYGQSISREFVDVFLLKKDCQISDIKIQKSEVQEAKFFKLEDFFDMVKKKDKKLLPHYEEYEKVVPILKEKFALN